MALAVRALAVAAFVVAVVVTNVNAASTIASSDDPSDEAFVELAQDHNDLSTGMVNFVIQASRDLTNALMAKRDLIIQEMVVLANQVVTTLVGWLNFAFQLANVNVTQISITPNASGPFGSSADGTSSAPTPIVPILGRTIQQEDLHFLERFVLDTVYVIKAWNKKLRTQANPSANATLSP